MKAQPTDSPAGYFQNYNIGMDMLIGQIWLVIVDVFYLVLDKISVMV